MWQRILMLLGFVPAVAAGLASRKGNDQEHGLETDGQASIRFEAGAKTAVPTDVEETQDERLARITDRALVWPGKPEKIFCANQETIACRYDLSITDLPENLYFKKPANGGVWQPQGGVLLQPGEEASFEVIFVPPPASDKTRTRPFSYVLTRFDPRRSADPGEIEADQPMRWVALPEPGDLKIAAESLHVVTRPWRRAALIQIGLKNKALLPASVALQIVRAAAKEDLVKDPEDVDRIAQSVPEQTPGTWRCLLPPYPERASYYATVTGAARVADREDYPLSLPKPVHVQYVPWLRMARDWFFLLGMLLLLLWIAWGFPIYKTPKILVATQFTGLGDGEFPAGSAPADLIMVGQWKDANSVPVGDKVTGAPPSRGVTEIDLPGRWCGFRWFGKSGWNGSSRVSQGFSVSLSAAPGKDAEFGKYSLGEAYLDGGDTLNASDLANPFDEWTVLKTIRVPLKSGVYVHVRVKDLGWLASKKDQQYTAITYTLDGTPSQLANLPLPRNPESPVRDIDLSSQVTDASTHELVVSATCLGSSTANVTTDVRSRTQPYDVDLVFPSAPPVDPKAQAAAAAQTDAAAAGKAATGAQAAATQAAAAAGANPSPQAKAQVAAATDAAKDAAQAAQSATDAANAAKTAPTPDEAQVDAGKAAQAQSDAANYQKTATDALTQVQKIAHASPIVVPPVIVHPIVVTPKPELTAEDLLLLDQWDKARDAASKKPDSAYQAAVTAISYALPKTAPALNLEQAKAEYARAIEAAQSPDDKALAQVAQGWCTRRGGNYADARADFGLAQQTQPNLLLVKVSSAEGKQAPEDRIAALKGLLNDPALTAMDKKGIQHQIDDMNAILH